MDQVGGRGAEAQTLGGRNLREVGQDEEGREELQVE